MCMTFKVQTVLSYKHIKKDKKKGKSNFLKLTKQSPFVTLDKEVNYETLYIRGANQDVDDKFHNFNDVC
jgi:hypothetical protein